jgi:hypothetical protein
LDTEDLFSRISVLETLGLFDPGTIGMRFGGRFIDRHFLEVFNREEGQAEGSFNYSELRSAFLAGIPSALLAHETAHLWQTVGTNWGIRTLFHLFSSTALLLDLAHAAHSADSTKLHVGIANDESLCSNPGVSRHLRELETYLNYIAEIQGGIVLPWTRIREMTDAPEESSVARVIGYRKGRLPLHFVKVVDAEEEVGVLLGNVHLCEGYGALVEEFRASRSTADDDQQLAKEQEGHPFHPYYVLSYLYKKLLPQHPEPKFEFMEFAVIVDTVLMSDSALHGSLTGQARLDVNVVPIDTLLEMFAAMQESPNLRLKDLGPDDVKRFQEALLTSIGAPIWKMAELTEIAAETMPLVLDAVSSTFPMVYDLRDSWRRASELAITYRRKAGGACPFVALVLSPRAELEQIALSAGGLVQIGPMGVTDKFASEATRTQFIHAMFSTLRQNLTDLAATSREVVYEMTTSRSISI